MIVQMGSASGLASHAFSANASERRRAASAFDLYTAVSAGTKRFLHEMRVVSSITLIEPEPHEPVTNFLNLNALVAYRLKPYEDHADRLLARKALPAEVKLTDPALRPLLEAAGRVFVALGRTSPPTA
jgi:hypothetical protein